MNFFVKENEQWLIWCVVYFFFCKNHFESQVNRKLWITLIENCVRRANVANKFFSQFSFAARKFFLKSYVALHARTLGPAWTKLTILDF